MKIDKDIQAVKDAIPFPAKMKLEDGRVVEGKITGRQCEFPHFVHDTCRQHIGCEISWSLALRILRGERVCIIY